MDSLPLLSRLAIVLASLLLFFPLWVGAARLLPAWGFDFTTPLASLLAAILGIFAVCLSPKWRLFLSLPALGLVLCCFAWARDHALILNLPCDLGTELCRTEWSRIAGQSARTYGPLLALGLLPLTAAIALGLRQTYRVFFGMELLLLLVGLAVYMQVALGFAPAPAPF